MDRLTHYFTYKERFFMKNMIEKEDTKKLSNLFGDRVKLRNDETCKNVIDILFATKEKFHRLRQHIFYNHELLLNTSILSDKKKLMNHIERSQEELEDLEDDISTCELKLEEQLWSADLVLSTTLSEENKQVTSPPETTLINDLNQLKQDIDNLKMDHKISFFCKDITYPTYTKNAGVHWSKKNQQDLNTIQKTIDEEKIRDDQKNRQIKTQYKKITDSTQTVMKHDLYSYAQSWRTGILNALGLLTGVGLMVGLYNKASGGNFLMWEKTRRAELHMKEGDLLRGSADILGIPKNR
jgi:hypothetical protein